MVSVVLFHSLESSFSGVNGLFEIQLFTLKPPSFKILSKSSATYRVSCTLFSEWQMSSMYTSFFSTFAASGYNSSSSDDTREFERSPLTLRVAGYDNNGPLRYDISFVMFTSALRYDELCVMAKKYKYPCQ